MKKVFVLLLAAAAISVAETFPAPAVDDTPASQPGKATAIFAGGCFWGVQGVFERVKGVLSTTASASRAGIRETPVMKTSVEEIRGTQNR